MSATANTQLIEAAKKNDVAGIQAALKAVSQASSRRPRASGALERVAATPEESAGTRRGEEEAFFPWPFFFFVCVWGCRP